MPDFLKLASDLTRLHAETVLHQGTTILKLEGAVTRAEEHAADELLRKMSVTGEFAEGAK